MTDHGLAYYHCRRDVAPRCHATRIREDVLIAWATALFDRLQEVQPEAVGGAVAAARSRRMSRPGSAEQLEASLQRLEKLFVWATLPKTSTSRGAVTSSNFGASSLGCRRGPRWPQNALGVGEAWRAADPGRRHQLLGTFFEKLYVREGDVVKYVPRCEYHPEVEALISLAVGDGLEYDRPITGRGANLTREARDARERAASDFGGKGGIFLRLRRRLRTSPA